MSALQEGGSGCAGKDHLTKPSSCSPVSRAQGFHRMSAIPLGTKIQNVTIRASQSLP